MNRSRRIAGLFFAAAVLGDGLAVGAAGAVEAPQVAGRIAPNDGRAHGYPIIHHPDGSEEPAHYPALLSARDHLVLRKGEAVIYSLGGHKPQVKSGPCDWPVPDPERRSSDVAAKILASINDFLYHPPSPPALPTYARRGGFAADGPPAPDLWLAPTGEQDLAPHTSSVALVWNGRVDKLVVETPGRPDRTLHPRGANALVLPVPQNAPAGFVVRTGDRALIWRFAYATQAPPTPLPGNPTTPGDRLAQALSLLQSGPPQWRVFALSELAALAKAGDFVAAELWSAARHGELPPDLKTAAPPAQALGE